LLRSCSIFAHGEVKRAFMYQKIKKLIIDDKPETETPLVSDPVNTPPADDKTDIV